MFVRSCRAGLALMAVPLYTDALLAGRMRSVLELPVAWASLPSC